MSRAIAENTQSIGSLLRITQAAMVQKYGKWLATSPYSDIQPAHASALQPLWQRREGVRLTELAQIARITKQSMGALVDSLEAAGYVERLDDPDDGRAWRVRLTARGRSFGRDVRRFAREMDARIEERIGSEKFKTFRSALQDLVTSLQED